MTTTNRIGTLPAATLTQRLRAMSEIQLADAARALVANPEADQVLTAVLETLERRISAPTFEAFVAELFA